MLNLKNSLCATFIGVLLSTASCVLPSFAKEVVTIDVVNEPSTLDPHVQWNPDSYYVYRNIFDNLLSRDDQGEIVPQIATKWQCLISGMLSGGNYMSMAAC